MYAGKDSSRRMINILFIGAITTLSITLTNAGKYMKCTEGFQSSDGGWSMGTGKAECSTGSGAYVCDINSCGSGSPKGIRDLKQSVFHSCSKDLYAMGNLMIYVLSYEINNQSLIVHGKLNPGDSKVIEVYCQNTPQNQIYMAECDESQCS
ncbi:hypothetical protein PGT21_010468 [Puccinia graminis f. sp. tritici]|uniref:Uncharacterized protein n=1 Tax=Puccinia graminis f. sp. tritici TaxID=56615 RepID=A0A5B0PKU5_PUCGR|nr:hypothetical protein PGT21_010468 [Puccinia graminis f. sp. tritici]